MHYCGVSTVSHVISIAKKKIDNDHLSLTLLFSMSGGHQLSNVKFFHFQKSSCYPLSSGGIRI